MFFEILSGKRVNALTLSHPFPAVFVIELLVTRPVFMTPGAT